MSEDPSPEPADEPSLELPSLRSAFRRRRRSKPRPPQPAPRVTTPAPPPVEPPAPEGASPSAEPRRRGRRRPIRLRPRGPVAAAVTGALVGLALVGLTSGALHLCTRWRGTSSCGEPGLLLLVAITIVVTALGAVLLRLLGVATAVSTSLLGVGLLVVLVLLAQVAGVDLGPAVVAVPPASLLTHLAAWWLTTTYDEPGELTR